MSDRLEQVLQTFHGGRSEETVLYSFWKHFPFIDRDPEKLAEAHIAYYKRYNFDLMKISPHGRYSVVDFGCKLSNDVDPISGSTKCETCCVRYLEDWEPIEHIEVSEGEFGKQLKVIEKIEKSDSVVIPKMMTIFSPLMTAAKMDPNIVHHVNVAPQIIREGLAILTDVMIEFSKAAIECGSEGLFIASQHLQKGLFEWKDIEKLEINYIKTIISATRNKSEFSVLHIHGTDLYFEETVRNLNVEAINWHDQNTFPSLLEASKMFKGGLLGGIDEKGILMKGSHDDIDHAMRKVLTENQQILKRVIIAPGCVIPYKIPHEKMKLILEVIKKYKLVSNKSG